MSVTEPKANQTATDEMTVKSLRSSYVASNTGNMSDRSSVFDSLGRSGLASHESDWKRELIEHDIRL